MLSNGNRRVVDGDANGNEWTKIIKIVPNLCFQIIIIINIIIINLSIT